MSSADVVGSFPTPETQQNPTTAPVWALLRELNDESRTMMNDHQSCPGVPELCEHSQAVISQALEGFPTPAGVEAARHELARCQPCVQAIDFQVRFKLAMAERATDQAPPSLQLRITEALGRVDLGDIDVTDL